MTFLLLVLGFFFFYWINLWNLILFSTIFSVLAYMRVPAKNNDEPWKLDEEWRHCAVSGSSSVSVTINIWNSLHKKRTEVKQNWSPEYTEKKTFSVWMEDVSLIPNCIWTFKFWIIEYDNHISNDYVPYYVSLSHSHRIRYIVLC